MGTTLLRNARVVSTFTNTINKTNVLIKDDTIIGIGKTYTEADKIIDLKNKFLIPGLINAHMHIESSMLKPVEFAKLSLLHGMTTCVVDPHEIVNVAGEDGLKYMLEACRNVPLCFCFMLPSCVPATKFDISKGKLRARQMEKYFKLKDVYGLAEVMDYDAVINREKWIMDKIALANKYKKRIDGHAPCLTGERLIKYISTNIGTDHECSTLDEAYEKLSLGQWILIREGTEAKNLKTLSPLLKGPTSHRCCLATDDCEVLDLMYDGQIDHVLKKAVDYGVNPFDAIRAATYNAAKCYNIEKRGSIIVTYKADLVAVEDLKSFKVTDVFKNGEHIVKNGKLAIELSEGKNPYKAKMLNSFKMPKLSLDSFKIKHTGIKKSRVIGVIPESLLTKHLKMDINYDINNGIDLKRDILKIAVIDAHKGTKSIALGFVKGYKMKSGAYASTVAHDSHNLIVIGTNEQDMLKAAIEVLKMRGGNIIVKDNKVIASIPFAIGGLMSDKEAIAVAKDLMNMRRKITTLGVSSKTHLFMSVSFLSLPVIPELKITPKGLVDVVKFKLVDLIVK